MGTYKGLILDVRSFQELRTKDFSFVYWDDIAVCALCVNFVCQTSSIKQHFETKHHKSFKKTGWEYRITEDSILLQKGKQHFQEGDSYKKSNN